MLRYQITIGVLCFALGAAVSLVIQNYRKSGVNGKDTTGTVFNQEGGIDESLDSFFDDDFFRSNKSPFDEMEKMRERMMNQFGSSRDDLMGGLFDSWFKKKFGGGDPGDIQTREDVNFVYYDVIIKDLSNQKLDIRVEEGQIKISGTIEKNRRIITRMKTPDSFSVQRFTGPFLFPTALMIPRFRWSRMVRRLLLNYLKLKMVVSFTKSLPEHIEI